MQGRDTSRYQPSITASFKGALKGVICGKVQFKENEIIHDMYWKWPKVNEDHLPQDVDYL